MHSAPNKPCVFNNTTTFFLLLAQLFIQVLYKKLAKQNRRFQAKNNGTAVSKRRQHSLPQLILIISMGLFITNSAKAADETLNKTGVVSDVAVDGSSSVMDWMVSHSNNTNNLMENVTLTDILEGSHTLVPGSLQLPPGWSAEYSTNGGASFDSSQPASDINAIHFNNSYVVPTGLGKGRTMSLPLSGPVNLSGGGDGYNPGILDNGRIMGINHHQTNPNLWCYDTETEAICAGYPKKPGIPTGLNPLTIGIGTKLYISDDSSGTNYGQQGKIHCWDSEADTSCGSSAVVTDGGYGGLVHVNGKLYVLTRGGKIDCYDPANALQQCKNFTPIDVGVVPGNTYNWQAQGSDMFVHNGRIYVSSNTNKLNCFDTATDAICTDWAAPLTLTAGRFDLFKRMNTTGEITGFCAAGANTDATCYDFDGTNPTELALSGIHEGAPGLHAYTETYVDTRVFFPHYLNDRIGCWDWATGAACTGSNMTNGIFGSGIAGRVYATNTDGACVYSFGDAGKLISWDPDTGATPCISSTGKLTVPMEEYSCDGVADATLQWDKVKFFDTDLNAGKDFNTLKVKIVNGATGKILKGPIEMVDSSGEVDISDIPANIKELELRSVGRPVGKNAWNDGVPPKVTMSFTSAKPPQFCYQTAVTCSAGDGLMRNTVTTNITDGISATASAAGCNPPPEITSSDAIEFYSESTDVAIDVVSTDDADAEKADGSGLVYSLSGGADVALFDIDTIGKITFKVPPVITDPKDADKDNIYEVEVSVADQKGAITKQLIKITVIKDSDGDGVKDSIDLDDDNDGILDSVEGEATTVTMTLDPANSSNGNLVYTGTYKGTTESVTVTLPTSHPGLVGSSGVEETNKAILKSNGDVELWDLGAPSESVLLFNATLPIKELVFTNLEGFDNFPNSARDAIAFNKSGHWITTNGAQLAEYDPATGNLVSQNPNGNASANMSDFSSSGLEFVTKGAKSPLYMRSPQGGTTNGANVKFIADQAFTSIALLYEDVSQNGAREYVASKFSIPAFEITIIDPAVDTDSDNIPNYLDLDSDGDGIPDNIEAQTTAGYIAPNNVFDADGVDTAYTGGLTPNNNDLLDTPDYLDLESDNVAPNDTTEAGIELTGLDDDGDGLDNAADTDDANFGPVNADITDVLNAYPKIDAEVKWRVPNTPPEITSSNTKDVPENQTAVMTVTATDIDDDTVTFSLTGGVDQALFEITPEGILTFKVAPDFENPSDVLGTTPAADNVYEIEVTADDSNGGLDVQTLLVTVIDVNDPPVITSADTSHVDENTKPAITVTSTDQDPNETATYSITGGVDGGLFTIDTNTGDLAFIDAPNFEKPLDSAGTTAKRQCV